MTLPSGPIIFNASTGSDTAASGLGPTPAVTGSGASTTSGSAVVTGIDTTGVSAGHLLWVSSSSGRQFSVVASVDSGTQVTCVDTFTNTEAGRTWAIGGKRAEFTSTSSRTIFSATGAKPGWIIQTETAQEITASAIVCATAGSPSTGLITVRGSSQLSCIQSANAPHFAPSVSGWMFENFIFTNSNGTKTNAIAIGPSTGNASTFARRCVFGDKTGSNHILSGMGRIGTNFFLAVECEFVNCRSDGLFTSTTLSGATCCAVFCSFTNCNVTSGTAALNGSAVVAVNCKFIKNAAEAIRTTREIRIVVGCIFEGNAVDATNNTGAATTFIDAVIANVFAANGAFGVVGNSFSILDYNAFGFPANTSGTVSGTTEDSGAITLTADPFTWSKTLTAVSWTNATKRLNKTGGFTNVHIGQSVNVTGGTGVTPGLYAIASVDSNDQITLVASIAGSDTTDVTTEPVFNINNYAGGGALLRAATVVLP